MHVFCDLQHQVSNGEEVQRKAVISPSGDSGLFSAVFITVPPNHEFPFHVHPSSEDCFFILGGSGDVFAKAASFSVSPISAVWVPPGVPHGLTAGEEGVIEIGFQAPVGITLDVDSSALDQSEGEVVVTSVPFGSGQPESSCLWQPVFFNRDHWRYFDPHYCSLGASQCLTLAAENYDLAVIVAKGKVRLEPSGTIGAVSLVHLPLGESATIYAETDDTLLIGVRVYSAD